MFWGEITSTKDWCEENYDKTPYIAEFYNTISNIIYIIVGINILRISRNIKYKFPVSFRITVYSIIFLGISSGLFHSTLSYWSQVIDRISCIFPLITILGNFMNINYFFLSFLSFFFILMFGVMFEIYLILLVLYNIYQGYSILNYIYERNIRRNVLKALVIFLCSFCMWLLDMPMCNYININFHAIWHILTGIGFHELCLVLMYIHLWKSNYKPKFISVNFITIGLKII